jgi:hypothetical protein
MKKFRKLYKKANKENEENRRRFFTGMPYQNKYFLKLIEHVIKQYKEIIKKADGS